MTSPTFRAASRNFVIGGAPTDITATEPTGSASGDGLLAALLIEVGGTSPGTVNTPSGWTYIGRSTASAFTVDYFKILRGGSAPTYTFSWTVGLNGTFGYAELNVIGFSGVVGSSFVESYSLGSGGTGTQPDPPAVTTLTTDTTVVAFGFSWSGWAAAASLTGYTSRFGGTTYDAVGLSKAVAAAGLEDPGLISAADGSNSIAAATFVLASVPYGSTYIARGTIPFID